MPPGVVKVPVVTLPLGPATELTLPPRPWPPCVERPTVLPEGAAAPGQQAGTSSMGRRVAAVKGQRHLHRHTLATPQNGRRCWEPSQPMMRAFCGAPVTSHARPCGDSPSEQSDLPSTRWPHDHLGENEGALLLLARLHIVITGNCKAQARRGLWGDARQQGAQGAPPCVQLAQALDGCCACEGTCSALPCAASNNKCNERLLGVAFAALPLRPPPPPPPLPRAWHLSTTSTPAAPHAVPTRMCVHSLACFAKDVDAEERLEGGLHAAAAARVHHFGQPVSRAHDGGGAWRKGVDGQGRGRGRAPREGRWGIHFEDGSRRRCVHVHGTYSQRPALAVACMQVTLVTQPRVAAMYSQRMCGVLACTARETHVGHRPAATPKACIHQAPGSVA